MARDRTGEDYVRPIRRLLVGMLVVVLGGIFLLWRIDSPRMERVRAMVVDRVVPPMDWAMAPVTGMAHLVADFRSYQRIHEQNQQLRRELQQMRAWREAALQLEQENARLLDLNNVRLDPQLTYITGVVMADFGLAVPAVGAPERRRSRRDDRRLAGDGRDRPGRPDLGRRRDHGTGDPADRHVEPDPGHDPAVGPARDPGRRQHRLPAARLPRGPARRCGRATGSSPPAMAGVFPADLLVGQVALGNDGRLRVRLAADYERLEFLRVLRSQPREEITDPGTLVLPELSMQPGRTRRRGSGGAQPWLRGAHRPTAGSAVACSSRSRWR